MALPRVRKRLLMCGLVMALYCVPFFSPATPMADAEGGSTFYVATNGDDRWSGTLHTVSADGNDGPFATLTRARDAVRELRRRGGDGPATIVVRGGTYRLRETFTLGPEDSGTETHPLTIRAYDGERPVLSGSLPVGDFVRHQGDIYRAALAGAGVESHAPRQLFSRGVRQVLARFPGVDRSDPVGGGFLYVADAVAGGSRERFKFDGGGFPEGADAEGMEVVIFPGPNYWNNTIPVASIDRENRIVTLAGGASYPITKGNRYYLQNALGVLDAPGEWFYDRRRAMLFFWPEEGGVPDSVSVPVVDTLVQIKGKTWYGKHKEAAAHIRVEGIIFEGCDGSVVTARETRDVVIAGCTIHNAGGAGIEMTAGSGNRVTSNDIYDVGGSGIILSGGDPATLAPGANRVENNHIHHIGSFSKNVNGIDCSGVGNLVSHNLVHATPRIGILFDGNDHVVEYNHVYDVNRETQDSGVIYSCARDWTKRGNVVRFNYVHDSGGYGRRNEREPWQRPFKTWGIYLDDFTSGTEVYGNVVTGTVQGGILIHGGRDNLVENNILVEAGTIGQVVFSALPPDSDHLPQMYARVREWRLDRYPALSAITSPREGATMSGNVLRRNVISYQAPASAAFTVYGALDRATTVSDFNVIYHGSGPVEVRDAGSSQTSWKSWLARGMDRNSRIADPALEWGSFRLAPGSAALAMGFVQVPFEKIGLYRDQWRREVPREAGR